MKKICIIHNSRFGNSEKVGNQIAEGLKDNYELNVASIKKTTPEDIVKYEPFALIIAVRILSFMSDKKIRKFITNLDKVIKKSSVKVAYFSTHAMRWREGFIKGMKKTLEKVDFVEKVCPEYLKVRVQGNKGPPFEGSDEKIEEFISTLKKFMN